MIDECETEKYILICKSIRRDGVNNVLGFTSLPSAQKHMQWLIDNNFSSRIRLAYLLEEYTGKETQK